MDYFSVEEKENISEFVYYIIQCTVCCLLSGGSREGEGEGQVME